MSNLTTIFVPQRTQVYQAVQELLGPHQDNQGESSRLALLYGRLPFTFLETKLRFDQMKAKVMQ